MCLVTAVEKFLNGVEGEEDCLAGEFILVAGVSGTCVRAAECSLREVNEVAGIERPGKRRCEGMITVFYCIRVPGRLLTL